MKITWKKAAIISMFAAAAGIGASKCTSTAAINSNGRVIESVKVLNPKRYQEIMQSNKKDDMKTWNAALEEITDSLRKLNSDAAKGYFRANQLLKIK